MRALVETGMPHATWDQHRRGDRGRRTSAARHIDAGAGDPVRGRRGDPARRFKVALDCVRGAGATMMPAAARAARLRGGGDQPGAGRALSARAGADPGEPSASSSGSCRRAGRTSGSRWILTWTGWRSSVTRDGRSARTTRSRSPRELVLRHRAGPVVTNLSTSLLVEDVAREAGVRGGPGAGGRGERRGADARRGRADRRRGKWRSHPARGASGARCADRRGPASAIAGGGGAAAVGRSRGRCRVTSIVKDKLATAEREPGRGVRSAARRRFRTRRRTRRTGCGWRGRTGGCTFGRRERSRSCA